MGELGGGDWHKLKVQAEIAWDQMENKMKKWPNKWMISSGILCDL